MLTYHYFSVDYSYISLSGYLRFTIIGFEVSSFIYSIACLSFVIRRLTSGPHCYCHNTLSAISATCWAWLMPYWFHYLLLSAGWNMSSRLLPHHIGIVTPGFAFNTHFWALMALSHAIIESSAFWAHCFILSALTTMKLILHLQQSRRHFYLLRDICDENWWLFLDYIDIIELDDMLDDAFSPHLRASNIYFRRRRARVDGGEYSFFAR